MIRNLLKKLPIAGDTEAAPKEEIPSAGDRRVVILVDSVEISIPVLLRDVMIVIDPQDNLNRN